MKYKEKREQKRSTQQLNFQTILRLRFWQTVWKETNLVSIIEAKLSYDDKRLNEVATEKTDALKNYYPWDLVCTTLWTQIHPGPGASLDRE